MTGLNHARTVGSVQHGWCRTMTRSMIWMICAGAGLLLGRCVDAHAESLTQEFNVRMPMADGIELSADIYRPATLDRVPVVLIRTPYTKSTVAYADSGRWWAQHGYAFVVQDVRGRGDSEGKFYPLVSEASDGYDTLEWIGHQKWSSGSVGMIGSSYVGWTQVYAATRSSRFLKAIVPGNTPPDPNRNFPLSFGVPMLDGVAWLALIDGHTMQNLSSVDFDEAFHGAPLSALDKYFGRQLPAWHDWLNHPTDDAYWQAQSYQQKLLAAKVPALHISGWYDDVLVGTTENFVNITTQALDVQTRRSQSLLIGPWPHSATTGQHLGSIDFGPSSDVDLQLLQLRWFDHWLKGIDNGIGKDPPVRIFVMGVNRWVDENEWPIARTTYVKYFLHSNGHANSRMGSGSLSTVAPRSEPADRFQYDPADPAPFITDRRNTVQVGGPDDYSEVELRKDILVYTTAATEEPQWICGPLRVRLFAASSALDTDFTAKVLDVHPDGFAQRLNDGLIRARFRLGNDRQVLLKRGEVEDYDIDVWSTCLELQKGHRLRLEISSSSFPKFDRNLNTGGTLGAETSGVIARQQVFHEQLHQSYLLLPVVRPRM